MSTAAPVVDEIGNEVGSDVVGVALDGGALDGTATTLSVVVTSGLDGSTDELVPAQAATRPDTLSKIHPRRTFMTAP